MKKLNLEEAFLWELKNIIKDNPFDKSYLLGVSGGSDSMCLANLFLVSGLTFSVAHVNYSLRGADSIDDMNFVIAWAKENKISCYTKVIDTPHILEANGGNTQELARNIRYHFFEEIRLKNGIDFVCTAHHSSDWLETITFNFFRGGFLNALVGMSHKNGDILRPLLYLEKSMISQYLMQKEIPFRIDSSNEKLIYNRNLIRHKILPFLNKINPSLLSTFLQNKIIWLEMIQIKNTFIEREFKQIITEISENEFLVSLEGLNNSIAPITFLHEILRPKGFTSKTIFEIDKRRGKSVSIGTIFIQGNWKMVKLEHHLRFIKESLTNIPLNLLEIKRVGEYSFHLNRKIKIENAISFPENFNQGEHKIFVDAKKIVFPLILRKWEPGDIFFPINMNNHSKKVQDLLTDKKLDKIKKKEVFVLQNANGQIIWVIGLRQDNRFKIEPITEHILIFEHKIN
ncbi:MAG: hypothetical protein RLZZ417_1022 [Bacteroidota bacterium]